MTRSGLALIAGIGLAACRGEPPRPPADELAHVVDSLKPAIEAAAGLQFTRPVRSALRSREQVRAYLIQEFDDQLPPERLEGLENAYHLFGLLPDSQQLRPLLIDVLTEQVAGYYDPDSTTLYGVADQKGIQLRAVVAHELVHALQDQHYPLDSLLEQQEDGDRAAAAQAILEGQAHYASVKLLVGEAADVTTMEFWDTAREQTRQAQEQLPRFGKAPVAIREELLFPYISGAEFMRWWFVNHPDALPFDERMPLSTEQIFHPDRYAAGDAPLTVRFTTSDSTVMFEDDVGELGLATLAASAANTVAISTTRAYGWGGDRYRVYRTPGGPALVWFVLFDDPAYADRFYTGLASVMERDFKRPGYAFHRERVEVEGSAGVKVVVGPEGWEPLEVVQVKKERER